MIALAEEVFQKYARVQLSEISSKQFGLVWIGLVGKSGNGGIRPIVASACLSPLGGDFALPL